MFGQNVTAIVQSGNLLKVSGARPSDGQFEIQRTWGLTDPDSLIGSTYANKTQFVYGVNDWDSSKTTGTSGFYAGLYGRNSQFRLLITDNNVSSYSAYLNVTQMGLGLRQLQLQAPTPYPSGIAKKYELHLYDFAFEGTVFGARRYSFEFKVLYDSLIVLESMTGTTRNEVRGYIDYIDWCLDPYSLLQPVGVGLTPPGYIELNEFSFQINGDDSCTPTSPPIPPI